MLVSAGNFHGQPLAFALDALAMAVSELASIAERRVERLVNPNLSGGLPPFLTTDGGLNSGFMIPQYVAASLVSENKVLSHPASVDSIPTSAGQEDHVSMGNAAGLKAWQVLANAEWAAGDRAARRRPGGGVPCAARARARGGCGPVVRAGAVAAADRRPSAGGRHRRGGGRDPRRVADRCGRGRSGGVAMSTTETLAATVESLCGDLSSIRAPRGLGAARAVMVDRGSAADAAEQPRPGGRRAAGGAGRLRRLGPGGAEPRRAAGDRRTLLRLGEDETLLVQSGKPVGVFRTHPGAPRVLIANAMLVPRWATWDEFRRLEALGLTMYGQMTAGAGSTSAPRESCRGRTRRSRRRPSSTSARRPRGPVDPDRRAWAGWAARSRSRRRC